MSGEPDRDGEPRPHGESGDWSDVDVDAAFAAIIAQYTEAGPQIGPWPVAEDLDVSSAESGPSVVRPESGTPAGPTALGDRPSPGGTAGGPEAGSGPEPAVGGTEPGSAPGTGPGTARGSAPGTEPGSDMSSASGGASVSGGSASGGASVSGGPAASGRLGTPPRSGPDGPDVDDGRAGDHTSGDLGAWPGDVSSWPHDARSRQHRQGEPPPTYGTHDLHEAGPGETARRDRRPDTGDDLPDRPGGRHVFDRVQEPDEPDEDRFVPPEPPPLPRGDFLTTFAWVCVLGGPLFLLFAALAWTDIPGILIVAGVAAFIGGFVALVARMPNEHPDDPDDGAVV